MLTSPALETSISFEGWQIIGFVVLVFGTFMYNEVFHLSFIPFLRPPPADYVGVQDEIEPLLNPVSGQPSTIQRGSQAA